MCKCVKCNCLIHALVAICVRCYFCYAKYWSKQKHLLPFHDILNSK